MRLPSPFDDRLTSCQEQKYSVSAGYLKVGLIVEIPSTDNSVVLFSLRTGWKGQHPLPLWGEVIWGNGSPLTQGCDCLDILCTSQLPDSRFSYRIEANLSYKWFFNEQYTKLGWPLTSKLGLLLVLIRTSPHQSRLSRKGKEPMSWNRFASDSMSSA